MDSLDLSGRRALVAGVGDADGFGWAIARALRAAGAEILVGTWPPILNIFRTNLERGRLDESRRLPDGSKLDFARIYPLDAAYDNLEQVPEEVRTNRRYADLGDFTVRGLAEALGRDFGERCLDIYVHAIANGPEVQKDLLDTSRAGYLSAVSQSAYSHVALLSALGPLMRPGASAVSLSYRASAAVIPGYGGGMSSAKAALESDTRTLAFEAGRRWGVRVNAVSAGPLASRAARAIGLIDRMIRYYEANAPLRRRLEAEDVAGAVLFLAGPLARAVTGQVLYVDNGMQCMGVAEDAESLRER